MMPQGFAGLYRERQHTGVEAGGSNAATCAESLDITHDAFLRGRNPTDRHFFNSPSVIKCASSRSSFLRLRAMRFASRATHDGTRTITFLGIVNFGTAAEAMMSRLEQVLDPANPRGVLRLTRKRNKLKDAAAGTTIGISVIGGVSMIIAVVVIGAIFVLPLTFLGAWALMVGAFVLFSTGGAGVAFLATLVRDLYAKRVSRDDAEVAFAEVQRAKHELADERKEWQRTHFLPSLHDKDRQASTAVTPSLHDLLAGDCPPGHEPWRLSSLTFTNLTCDFTLARRVIRVYQSN